MTEREDTHLVAGPALDNWKFIEGYRRAVMKLLKPVLFPNVHSTVIRFMQQRAGRESPYDKATLYSPDSEKVTLPHGQRTALTHLFGAPAHGDRVAESDSFIYTNLNNNKFLRMNSMPRLQDRSTHLFVVPARGNRAAEWRAPS